LSRVIKSNSVGSTALKAKSIPFQAIHINEHEQNDSLSWTVEQARKESTKLLTDAKQEATQILADSFNEAEQRMKEIDQQKQSWEEEKIILQKKAYEEGRVTDLGLSDWENLRDHVAKLVTVDPQIEDRIVDLADQEPGTELPGGDVASEDFSGTIGAPKVYNGDVTVSVTGVASFENVTVKGNLILTGTPTGNVAFANITVKGNLDLSGLDGENFDFDGITVDGETIF